jgi:hypothetical protein
MVGEVPGFPARENGKDASCAGEKGVFLFFNRLFHHQIDITYCFKFTAVDFLPR